MTDVYTFQSNPSQTMPSITCDIHDTPVPRKIEYSYHPFTRDIGLCVFVTEINTSLQKHEGTLMTVPSIYYNFNRWNSKHMLLNITQHMLKNPDLVPIFQEHREAMTRLFDEYFDGEGNIKNALFNMKLAEQTRVVIQEMGGK